MESYTLNDIPEEVFNNFILPHVTVKEVGSLSMVSRDLRDICTEEEVWKNLYIRGLDGTVPKDREIPHVGPQSRREYRSIKVYERAHDVARDPSFSEEYKRLLRKRVIRLEYNWRWQGEGWTGHLITSRNLPGFTPVSYNVPDSKSYNYGICVGNLEEPGSIMCWASLPTHLRRKAPWYDRNAVGTPEQQNEFSNTIKKEWIEYNRSKGLSTVNLCQCAAHYRIEDLDNGSSKRNCKSYKKMVLKKMKTKQKHALKKYEPRRGRCKVSKKSIDILILEEKLEKMKKERDVMVEDRRRLTSLGKRLDDAI